MPITLKLSKSGDTDSSQMAESSSGRTKRQSKRRQAALYSDDEDNVQPSNTFQDTKPSKRARVEENADVDIDGEEEIDIDDEEEAPADDTRFLPPALRKMKAAQAQSTPAQKTKVKASSKKTASRKKKTVVYSDDDDDGYNTAEHDAALRSDDEDFVPENVPSKKSSSTKPKGKVSVASGKPGKSGRFGRDDREILIKNESRPSTSLKRSVSADDELSPAVKEDTPAKDPTPPPLKRPKLPTIKKNKITGTPTLPSKPPPKPPAETKTESVLPISGVRKPAGTANNADFDLRDKSVYAQLFTKPSGSTPNAGLNRKAQDEQRRKELFRMRDEARARRQEAPKETFDLQAPHEKIQRFAEKLLVRKSAAMYPNMLGGAFKDSFDRARLALSRNGLRSHS